MDERGDEEPEAKEGSVLDQVNDWACIAMKDWLNLVVGTAIAALVIWLIINAFFNNPEPNICSREYRDIYLRTHDNDDELRKECPSEPWYRED